MNELEFIELSEKTEKKFPNGLTIPPRLFVELSYNIDKVLEDHLGEVKKDVIYKLEDDKKGVPLTQDQIEMLHAVMGICTESVELLHVVWDWVLSNEDISKLDSVNVGEELKDISWYEAIILRKLNFDNAKLRENLIEKLKARYGEKFNSEGALNRDLKKERAILEK